MTMTNKYWYLVGIHKEDSTNQPDVIFGAMTRRECIQERQDTNDYKCMAIVISSLDATMREVLRKY